MPRYIFELRSNRAHKPRAMDLPDPECARLTAKQVAREIAAEGVAVGRLDLSQTLHVLDEAGALLLALPLKTVVAVTA